MVLFKRKHIERILEGRKVQTRRIHRREWKLGRTYAIKDRWFDKPKGHITIIRKFRERLGDISLEDVQKEGYGSLEEFRRAWEEIHGSGSWNPDLVVTVYEFRVCSKRGKPSSARASRPRE
ncbi:hypothetical protein KEJ15_09660 [Candidatus Bathyarchaeota archaeon]|nr:hypothetical protein [Candidatus Bathyarchaeota archaeon]